MLTTVACLQCGQRFSAQGAGAKNVCPQCGSRTYIQILGETAGLSDATASPVPASDAPDDRGKPRGEPNVPAVEPVPHDGAPRRQRIAADEAGRSPLRFPSAAWAPLALAAGAMVVAAFAWWIGRTGSPPPRAGQETGAVQVESAAEPASQPPAPPAATATATAENPGPAVPLIPKPPRPVEPASTATAVARSLQEVEKAVVKFELPQDIGIMQSGTGFVINDRGWVATNDHLAAGMTKAARVKLADGTRLELEGIVARDPQRDLAVVSIRNPPPQLIAMDIGYDGTPALGDQVYAFGHPYNADFSLSKGIVSRVLTTADLLDSPARHLVARLGAPADLVWIQHDAKTSPGNSGGPLLDERGRVLGINTFVHLKAEFGYASHIRYLRQLAAGATGAVEPLPEKRETIHTKVSTAAMSQLVAACAGFGWNPQTPEQYQHLADLAQQITLGKHLLSARATSPGGAQSALQNVARAADASFAAIRKVAWTPQHFEAINRYAADQVDQVGEGIVMASAVVGTDRNRGAVLMEIEGMETPVLVRVGDLAAKFAPGSRWFLIGFVTPEIARVNIEGRSATRPARIVLTHYLIERK